MRRGKIMGEEGEGEGREQRVPDGRRDRFCRNERRTKKKCPMGLRKLVLKENSAPRTVVRVRKNDVSGDG